MCRWAAAGCTVLAHGGFSSRLLLALLAEYAHAPLRPPRLGAARVNFARFGWKCARYLLLFITYLVCGVNGRT